MDLAFFRPYGRITVDGEQVFNQVKALPLQPADEAPVLSWDDPRVRWTGIFLRLFLPDGQLDHFTTAIAYPYRHALNGEAVKPLSLMFLGEHGVGKGFVTDWWLPRLFGQAKSGDATRLLKEENGGASCLLWYVNRVSDKSVPTEGDAATIQGGLLALLAEHTTGARWLYQDQVDIDINNLFCFSANPQATLLDILKGPGAAQLFNRMGVYCTGKGFVAMQDQHGKDLDPEFFLFPGRFLGKELPFVANLLKNWNCPKFQVKSRYGCRPYCHPNARRMIQLSPVANTVRQVLIDCMPYRIAMNGTASKIYGDLNKMLIPAMGCIRDLREFREALEELAGIELEAVIKHPYLDTDDHINSVLWEINPGKIRLGTVPPPLPPVPPAGVPPAPTAPSGSNDSAAAITGLLNGGVTGGPIR